MTCRHLSCTADATHYRRQLCAEHHVTLPHHCSTGYHVTPQRSCYDHHGCRCPGCCEDNRVYQRDYQRATRYDGHDRVEADATRALILWLRDKGASDNWIAEQAGLTQPTVWRIRAGQSLAYLPTRRAIERVARDVGSGALTPLRYRRAS